MPCFDRNTVSYGDDSRLWVHSRCASHYLAALFQLLLHLLGWQVNVDGEVRRQELADADALDLIVVLHACE